MRRLPWVTFTIMGLCLLALLATNGAAAEADQRAWEAYERLVVAFQGWYERPYLKFDPNAVADLPDDARNAIQIAGMQPPEVPRELDEVDIAAEQAELDAAIASAAGDLNKAKASHPYFEHGLVTGDLTLYGLFAHMFMHAGWLHLLGNMFMFFLAAPALEDRWGRKLFGAFYVAAGLASALFFVTVAGTAGSPLVGASGAIAGVLGAFFVRLWSTKIRFWFWVFFGIHGTFEAPAWAMLPLWFANEVFQALGKSAWGVTDSVAYEAHIGGFVFGAGVALAFKFSGLDARMDDAIEETITVRGNVALSEALALREQGDLTGAIRQLAGVVKKTPSDADAVDAYWDACAAQGCAGDAAHAVLALAQRELSANDGARAAQRFVEVRAALPGYGFDAGFVARLVPSLREMDREIALGALRWLAQPKSGALAPTLAQRAVDQARELDPLVAKQLARRLAAQVELPDAMRERFAALAKALDAEAPDPPPMEDSGIELAGERSGAASPFREYAAPESTPAWDHTAQSFEDEPGSAEAAAAETPLGPELTEPEPQITPAEDEWDALKLLESDPTPAPGPRFASLKLSEATPLALTDTGVSLALDGGRKALLAFAKIDGIALAAVRGLTAKPVLVIDLLVGWRSLEGGELRCVRLRSDRFDPRKLASEPDPLSALRAFVAQLIERSGATPLAAADPAHADALAPFADVATYEREVLEVSA